MRINHFLTEYVIRSWRITFLVCLLSPFLLSANDAQKIGELKELHDQALNSQNRVNRSTLDSIAEVMIEISSSAENDHYLNIGRYFKSDALSRKSPALAIEIGQEALSYFNSVDDHFNQSRLNNVMAHSYSNIGEHNLAVEYYNASIKYSKLLVDSNSNEEKKYRSRVYYNCGFALVRRGDLDAAMELFTKSHKTASELKDSLVVMSILHQFGNINLIRKEYTRALEDYQSAMILAEQIGYDHYLTPLLGIASVYQQIERRDSAILIYDKIIKRATDLNNITTLCAALTNNGELHLDIGDYKKGIELGNQLIDYAIAAGMEHQEMNGMLILIRAYKEQGLFLIANNWVDKAISKVKEDIAYDQASNLYFLASDLKEVQQDYKSALHYQKYYKQYSDSLVNQESIIKMDELKMQFKSDQKDAEIQQLKARNDLDTLVYNQRLTLLGALMIGLILLGVVVYLVVHRKRLLLLRQKENVERRLLRSQMNPHFIFNAISSIQNYLYDKSDLKVALNYMSKFAELMRQVLENSREEYVVLSDEIKSLENYLELQQLRYNNTFGYKIIIDKSLDIHQVMVPPLIAQPFVENAIEHGMIYRIENGQVNIAFKNNKENIDLRIEDNGVGENSVKIATKNVVQKKTSLAKVITSERLDLLSKIRKSKFDFSIAPIDSGGTLVSIQIPKISVA